MLGAAGGSQIPTAVVQGLWRVVDQGYGVQEAVDEPRWHDQLGGGGGGGGERVGSEARAGAGAGGTEEGEESDFIVEGRFSSVVAEEMRQRGHKVKNVGVAGSSMCGLRVMSLGGHGDGDGDGDEEERWEFEVGWERRKSDAGGSVV